MNRTFAAVLSLATTTAAIGCVAAIASSHSFAEMSTIDGTPTFAAPTRAEAQAELMGRADELVHLLSLHR